MSKADRNCTRLTLLHFVGAAESRWKNRTVLTKLLYNAQM